MITATVNYCTPSSDEESKDSKNFEPTNTLKDVEDWAKSVLGESATIQDVKFSNN